MAKEESVEEEKPEDKTLDDKKKKKRLNNFKRHRLGLMSFCSVEIHSFF